MLFGMSWAGCNYDASSLGSMGPDLVTVSGSTSATSTGTTGPASEGSLDAGTMTGTSASMEDSTSAPTTSDEQTGSSSGDPLPPPLLGGALLARWYIDDATKGQPPGLSLADSAPRPLNLPLLYAGNSPSFVEFEGNLGLRWVEPGMHGRPQVAIVGNKLDDDLNQSRTFTIELVVGVQALHPDLSRLFHVGTSSESDFAIGAPNPTELHVRWDGSNEVRRFFVDLTPVRQVIHVVVDTEQAVAADRIRAYHNGVPLRISTINENRPAEDEAIIFAPTAAMVLGNRSNGFRSFQGTFHYAAIYGEPLDPGQVANNVVALLASDDAP